MKPLFTEEEYLMSKSMDLLPYICSICHQVFYREKKYYTQYINGNKRYTFEFCSKNCKNLSERKSHTVNCKQCGKEIIKMNKVVYKSKTQNFFCTSSCAATYNNTHKTKGYRRSKLEIYIEKELKVLYPDLLMDFNQTDTINAELDIYIPSLKISFELNGVFHYEPIYGQNKLDKVQNNDSRKFQACLERGIELCIIDISSQKYFKEQTSKKFLDIIVTIINQKLVDKERIELP